MQIPNNFREALDRAYTNAGELNNLFVEHKSFLMRLVRHAARYRHWAVLSDEDDLFQEACIWLVNSLWEWDETKDVPLAEYVAYNVGARLRNQMAYEQRKKRHPDSPPISLSAHGMSNNPIRVGKNEIDRSFSDKKSMYLEGKIRAETPDPEALLIIRRAYDKIERELPLLARELLESLMLESGNISAASRRVLYSGRVRRVEGMSDDAFRQSLQRNILSQLRTILISENIISSNDSRL